MEKFAYFVKIVEFSNHTCAQTAIFNPNFARLIRSRVAKLKAQCLSNFLILRSWGVVEKLFDLQSIFYMLLGAFFVLFCFKYKKSKENFSKFLFFKMTN